MVKLTKSNGEIVSFSIKGAGRFFKGIVQKAVVYAKDAIVKGFKFIHKKLAELENYLLKKVDEAGKWAEGKIDERLPEPEPTPEPEPELIE